MEQRIAGIEKDMGEMKTLMESVAAAVLRLEAGQMRLEGMVQGLYFRDFQD